VAVVAIVAVVAVGRISKDGPVSSSGGGGPFPPEVHHLRNAMSSSVLERGSLDEIRAKRVLMGSLIITMTCASRCDSFVKYRVEFVNALCCKRCVDSFASLVSN
jgi:hypothetical protein